MRIIIDTEKEKIIVPDSFFAQVDKINKVLKDNGSKEIEHVEYIKKEFEKAIKNTVIRKSDLGK